MIKYEIHSHYKEDDIYFVVLNVTEPVATQVCIEFVIDEDYEIGPIAFEYSAFGGGENEDWYPLGGEAAYYQVADELFESLKLKMLIEMADEVIQS